MTYYRIGHLEDPRDDDPTYDDEDIATEAAINASIDDSVWAVWDCDDGQIRAVAYQMAAFFSG